MAETETVDAPVDPTPAPAPAAPAWLETLPEPLRAEKSLATFKDVGALAQSYVETKKLVGSKTEGMVKVPGADAKPDEVAAFHRALGVPESPDKYAIQRPEIALQGGWSEQAVKDFLAVAHKAGMTQAHVQAAISFYGQWEAQKLAEAQRQAQATMATLRQEMGPNYDANLGRANRAVQQFGGQELIDYLAQSGLGRHPAMVKTFVNIANAMVESGAMETAGDVGLDGEEAQTQLDAIYTNKQHAYWQVGHPDHEAAVRKVEALHRIKAGRDGSRVVASFREI